MHEILLELRNTKTESEWNAICDRVKANGGYPEWWYKEVVFSGLANQTASKWGGNDKIRIMVSE